MRERAEIHGQPTRRLSKAEAYRLVHMCAYLKGQHYYEQGTLLGEIECVAVSPHDAINKWLFLHYYADCHNPLKALGFYSVPFYDVILIIHTSADQLTYRNLDTYQPPQKMAG